jgi:hypothetical protein
MEWHPIFCISNKLLDDVNVAILQAKGTPQALVVIVQNVVPDLYKYLPSPRNLIYKLLTYLLTESEARRVVQPGLG